MVRTALSPAALAAPLFLALAARGQDIAQPPPTALAPLTITATRIATPVAAAPASITVIDSPEIEARQWITAPEALAGVPGLNVVQTGGAGGLTSVFIRGANADHTKVIIDGMDVNDPSTGVFDFGQLATLGVARIEVLRGPQSSLYGADALGGVVNVITAPGEGAPAIAARVEGGSFASANESLRFKAGDHRFGLAAGVANLFSGATPVTPPGLLARGERAIPDRWADLTAFTRLDWRPSPALAATLTARAVASDLKTTGEDFIVFPPIPDSAQTDQRARRLQVRASIEATSRGGALVNVFGVGWSRSTTRIQGPDEGQGVPPATLDAGDRLQADWQATAKVSRATTLVFGGEADRERLIGGPAEATDGAEGAFAEAQASPGRGVLLAASGRIDHDGRFGDAATWRIAPSWTIAATGTRLEASAGTGFKAPTLSQLFVSFPAFDFFANPDLKPERSFGWEIGFAQTLARGRLELGATWFSEAITDLISENAAFTSWANVGRASSHGVESFVAWRPARGWRARADYTWMLARDDLTGLELLRRPRNKLDLSVDWRDGRVELSGGLHYVGAWVDGDRAFVIPRLMASPYATLDFEARFRLGRGLSFTARVANALDRHYQNPVGFDGPPVGGFAGLVFDPKFP